MGYAVTIVVLADIAVICFCVFYFSRAGHALDERWERQWKVLEGARGALERLVGDADVRARDFDQVLGTRERQLRGLLYRLAEQEERLRRSEASTEPPPPAASRFASEVSRLSVAGLSPVEVAHELKVEPAQVRLVLDLHGQAEGARHDARA